MATVLAKGQLSYLILSCLEEKDMYGLELIDEIKKRSGFEIKLPSLYSNINRMKELKYISSYLKESTKGPKCAYSSITELGRAELKKLKETFGDSSAPQEVVKEEKETIEENISEIKEEVAIKSNQDIKNSFDDYNDFFADIPDEDEKPEAMTEEPQEVLSSEDIVNDDEEITENEEISESEEGQIALKDQIEENIEENEAEDENNVISSVEEKSDVLSVQGVQEIIQVETEAKNEVKNDAVFLDKNDYNADEYNKKLFDVSKDYYKYKKKKSFSENQIQMVVNDNPPLEERMERQHENVNSLKEALLRSRQGAYDEVKLTPPPVIKEDVKPVDEEKAPVVDDGVFITDRVDYIPKAKRFDPPKINLLNNVEAELPAPKRNISFDPNCSDVKARIDSLYQKAQAKAQPETKEVPASLRHEEGETYEDLKSYYEEQKISFKVYKRPDKRALHNTNKINFFVDLIVFGLIGVGSAILYLIFSQLGLTNPDTNFMYYLFPILYFVYLAIRFYTYKKLTSKVPKPLFNSIIVIGSAILLCGLVFCLNLAGGMIINSILSCSTTLFVPMFVILMIVVVRHYLMLFALKKYWR